MCMSFFSLCFICFVCVLVKHGSVIVTPIKFLNLESWIFEKMWVMNKCYIVYATSQWEMALHCIELTKDTPLLALMDEVCVSHEPCYLGCCYMATISEDLCHVYVVGCRCQCPWNNYSAQVLYTYRAICNTWLSGPRVRGKYFIPTLLWY